MFCRRNYVSQTDPRNPSRNKQALRVEVFSLWKFYPTLYKKGDLTTTRKKMYFSVTLLPFHLNPSVITTTTTRNDSVSRREIW